MAERSLEEVTEDLRTTAVFVAAEVNTLAREEACERKPSGVATWTQFRGRLRSPDLLELLLEDATVTQPTAFGVPAELNAVGAPRARHRRVDRVAGASHQWHTFAGGRTNRLLAWALEDLGAGTWTGRQPDVQGHGARGDGPVSAAIGRLREHDWDEQARRLVARSSHVQVSKFQPCLPQELETRLLIERLTDGATAAFNERHRTPIAS